MTNYPITDSQRELTVMVNGRPSLDMDPTDVYNNGDVAGAWDARLYGILETFYTHDITDATLVWTDTNAPIMIECPTCNCVTTADKFVAADDDDCVVCRDCN